MLAGQINAVDIDADALLAGRLIGVVRHDAADADGQGGLTGLEGGDAQAGDAAVGQVHQALHVAIGQGFGVDDRDRDRRVLQVGFPLGRSHDDVVKTGRLGAGGRRRGLDRNGLGEGGNGRGEKGGPQQQLKAQFGLTMHFYPLLSRGGDYAVNAMRSLQPCNSPVHL